MDNTRSQKVKNFIISGAGGQGIISIDTLLASIYMLADYFVSFSSCYGAEMRGGAVNCEINTSETELFCLKRESADYVIALNQISFDKFINKVKKNGTIIVNSSMAKIQKTRDDIKYIFAPLTELAQKLGNIKFANSIALGLLSKLTDNFSLSAVKEAYNKTLKNKQDLIQKNIEAYTLGYNYIIEGK